MFTPSLTEDEQVKFTLKHVPMILQLDMQSWCHNSAMCPAVSLETEEDALQAYNFDLHAYVYAISYQQQTANQERDKLLLFLKPTQLFCNWLKENNEHLCCPESTPDNYDLTALRSESAAIVLPYLSSQLEADHFFNENYLMIFEYELAAWCKEKQYWPAQRTLSLFTDFFDFEYHNSAISFVE